MRRSTLWGGARRRLPVLGLATALLLGGGGGLVAVALSNSSAGAQTTLGGFTVTALAEGTTAQYEQPNFPFPATPTLEVDAGYAATSDNFGPTGNAVASSLYPGEVISNAGPELSLLVPGAALPPAPTWPIEAVTDYPEAPNTASLDEPGVNMDAVSSEDANTATATLGDDAATAGSTGPAGAAGSTSGGNVLAASSALIGIGGFSGTSSSAASGATAVASATSSLSGISILAGFISIGAVTSTATATSDGTNGTLTGSTVLGNVSIAGMPVTIDAGGIHATGTSALGALPISTLNTLLNELGVTLTVTNPTDSVQGPNASRTLDGLRLSINLDTLDAAVNKFASLLPASLTSQLPIPLPNMQVLTIDLGTVTVSSAASGAYDDTGGSGTAAGDSDVTPAGGSFTSPAFTGSGTFTGSGGTVPTGTGGGATTPSTTGSPSGGGTPSGEPASAVTPVFKGIGTGLILLGLVLAAALAYAYKRVDDVSEMVGPACVDGDPLGERFSDAGGAVTDAGDFGL